MKNRFVLAAVVTLLSTNVSFAATHHDAPDKCPSVQALTQDPLTLAQLDFKSNTYIAAAFDNAYDTNAKWILVIGNVKANSAADAINKATSDIPKFVLVSNEPVQFAPLNAWGCGYQSDVGYSVFAVSDSQPISSKSLSEIVNKLHS